MNSLVKMNPLSVSSSSSSTSSSQQHQHQQPEQIDPQSCPEVHDNDLREISRFASLALLVIYEENSVDLARLALLQVRQSGSS